ncbi:methyltransferase domain-containing protein [bacterium]|nr:methyltransferase domain-containing protein [bacterium]
MSLREKVSSWVQGLRHGRRLETDGMVHLETLGLAAEERRNYGPSGWKTIDRLARRVPLGPGDVFVDYGCGKGRIVYLAALHPVARVVGVELSPDLAAVARRNLEVAASRLRCRDVRIEVSDALAWPVPDDLTIAFFYSPFTGRLFEGVVENLRRSVERAPRGLWIVHQRLADSHDRHPAVLCSRHLEGLDWLEAVDRVPNGPAILECFRARAYAGATSTTGSGVRDTKPS